jgi:hypothetical protein
VTGLWKTLGRAWMRRLNTAGNVVSGTLSMILTESSEVEENREYC